MMLEIALLAAQAVSVIKTPYIVYGADCITLHAEKTQLAMKMKDGYPDKATAVIEKIVVEYKPACTTAHYELREGPPARGSGL
jgi:hypothetical protein